ncbi:LPXTG cell wall anchor domain-containing protein [Herbiconiux sp. CPCC 205763]|uniref:LPXTG cell wall anchor domain-containing protein n=1 Tax=Herbiconiux aconitum TaxID=2970913 RepID=A0ABT2GYK7_9MICO|nr:LPXTG cell wall anchor domain-containing protein [Herbiconiux aconitum]MCS5720019.1 LPXTG cell wall anchor domain-containing protein [Herbiconiux aconitum]
MKSGAGRITLIVVGIVALLVGVVFAGQGANLIPGSSMTGDSTWLYVGIALAVVGVVLLVIGIRRRKDGH